MVNVKERDPIRAWVRKYGHLLGPGDEQPDESDQGFNVESDDSDDSGDGFDTRSSRSGFEGGNDDDEEEAEGGGSDEAGGDENDEMEEPLDPARHPLLRAERLPKGVADMVVGIVEDAFVGSAGRDGDDQLDEEEDELED